jgi:predicted permease
MDNILLLLLCLFAGIALRWSGRVPEGGHVAINAFVIHLSLPALILLQIHRAHFGLGLLGPVAMPWVMFLLGAAVFWAAARAWRLSRGTAGALVLTGALANTSFVGLPMIETFYGRDQMATGIVIDQLGTYLVLSTLGVTVACLASGGAASPRALLLAVLLLPADYPPLVVHVLTRLGDTLAPLALVSVGLQLRPRALSGRRRILALGLGFKLVLAPLLLALLYLGVLRGSGETTHVTLFEAAMGPQIGGAVVATQYGLDPPLVSLMVGVGILLSFLTAPAWWLLLRGF